MANLFAIRSVGASLATTLQNAYDSAREGALAAEYPCNFAVHSSTEMATLDPDGSHLVSLYLYRVTVNEHLRGAPGGRPGAPTRPLSVDLHYLASVWSGSAEAEHTLIAWLMYQLHRHPILDRSSLSPDGGWDSEEMVQLIPAELSNEDQMRIWDALAPSYRLSVSYIARVVRLDAGETPDGEPVVARRLNFTDAVEAADDR